MQQIVKEKLYLSVHMVSTPFFSSLSSFFLSSFLGLLHFPYLSLPLCLVCPPPPLASCCTYTLPEEWTRTARLNGSLFGTHITHTHFGTYTHILAHTRILFTHTDTSIYIHAQLMHKQPFHFFTKLACNLTRFPIRWPMISNMVFQLIRHTKPFIVTWRQIYEKLPG